MSVSSNQRWIRASGFAARRPAGAIILVLGLLVSGSAGGARAQVAATGSSSSANQVSAAGITSENLEWIKTVSVPYVVDESAIQKLKKAFEFADHCLPENGNYLDGGPAVSVGGLVGEGGCAAHYFDPHPNFLHGGLVAHSTRGHGMKLLEVASPDGKISEGGFYLLE